jgi:predicted Zn-dependent protease
MRCLTALAIALLLAGNAMAQGFTLDFGKLIDIGKKATQLQSMDSAQEAELGAGVASNLLGAAPLVNDPDLQRYVNRVGLWLALQTERSDVTWRFGVLETTDLNAFATPGGYIFVTRGLLSIMRTEAELAGVLAHEIAHVLQKHHLNAIQKNAATGIGADALGIFLDQKASGLKREALGKLVGTGTELYARGLDRDDELEADRMGVVIAARAGYDPYGLAAVLQRLDAVNPEAGPAALMFKTHPKPADRLQALERILAPGLEPYSAQPAVAERFLGEAARTARP